jgi:hypothetical protein
VMYRHDTLSPYWVIAAPSGTTRRRLEESGLPAEAAEFVAGCLRHGESVLAVTEAQRSDCVQPISFPAVLGLMLVSKRSGESTQLTIRRAGIALELVAIQ